MQNQSCPHESEVGEAYARFNGPVTIKFNDTYDFSGGRYGSRKTASRMGDGPPVHGHLLQGRRPLEGKH